MPEHSHAAIIAAERWYWLATAGPSGRPQVRPVLAVWLDDRIYATTSPGAAKGRNLERHPECSPRTSLLRRAITALTAPSRIVGPAERTREGHWLQARQLIFTERVSYHSNVPRRTPPGRRLRDVARSACRVVIEKGYRRALLTGAGEAPGLSHSILFRHAESGEALFDLALRYATDPEASDAAVLPLATPPKGRALHLVKALAADQACVQLLEAASGDDAGSPVAELAGIVGARYAPAEGNRHLPAVIEQSAIGIPERCDFLGELRAASVSQLASYPGCHIAAGQLRPAPYAVAASRLTTPSVSWSGWHRKADPVPGMVSGEQARETVRELCWPCLPQLRRCRHVRRPPAAGGTRV